jgi:16S rRNA G1207 methylase RsmC
MPDCDCIELNPENREYLTTNGFNLVGDDFMSFEGEYDVIIANPPFSKQQDIDHINKMIDMARRKVVSVASASVLYRDNKKTLSFRERIESLGGTIEMLPENTFSESGTNVNTCVVVVNL